MHLMSKFTKFIFCCEVFLQKWKFSIVLQIEPVLGVRNPQIGEYKEWG